MPERKRQELASAIRTVARALARPPENIAADGRLLANRLKDVAPAAIGGSRLRWNNLRSPFRTGPTIVQRTSLARSEESESQVRNRLSAGGGSHERTRLGK